MKKVVLLRHGESEWNKENRFTGWTDVALNEKGIREAMEAGLALRREGYLLDVAFTSVPIRNYYLGDPEAAKRAVHAVADLLKQRT